MSLYTIVFIFVTILILIGLALFGRFIMWLDKKIDRMERLGGPSREKVKSKKEKEES